MKKYLAVIFLLLAAAGLCGCGAKAQSAPTATAAPSPQGRTKPMPEQSSAFEPPAWTGLSRWGRRAREELEVELFFVPENVEGENLLKDPIDGMALDFLREEYARDIKTVQEMYDGNSPTFGITAYPCDFNGDGLTDYFEHGTGFLYIPRPVASVFISLWLAQEDGGYLKIPAVDEMVSYGVQVKKLESETAGMPDLYSTYERQPWQSVYRYDPQSQGYKYLWVWVMQDLKDFDMNEQKVSPRDGMVLVAEKVWEDQPYGVEEGRLNRMVLYDREGRELKGLQWAAGPVKVEGRYYYRYCTVHLWHNTAEDFYLVDPGSGEVYRETEDGMETVGP